PRSNSESCSPWISSAGASIRPATLAGLDRSSVETAPGIACPVCAICWYIAQMLGRNRPHSTRFASAPADLVPGGLPPAGLLPAELLPGELPWPGSGVPNPTEPWVNSRPAHCFLNTPVARPPPTALGNSAVARLFHALCATTASIRLS